MKHLPPQDNNSNSGLIWITGYSGAGKTTVARITSEKLKGKNIPVVLLDGDELRSIFGGKFGYTIDDRIQLAYVYSRLCQAISNSGVTVVIAAIAMFETVRIENRASNQRYLEVYLDVPLMLRKERDPKGIYRAAEARISDPAGSGYGQDEPLNPDLIIANYGDTTAEISASLIVERYLELTFKAVVPDIHIVYNSPLSVTSSNRIKYWDTYYKNRKAPISPSSFALFCGENYLDQSCHILEFGCGNGRDSFFFSTNHTVTAIDESRVVIEAIQSRAHQERISSLNFFLGEFGRDIPGLPNEVDAVYGRFVLHAMDEDAETRVLSEAWRILKNDGKLLLEFRTTKDPLMAKGRQLGATERFTDHYRRFIDFEELLLKLSIIGFDFDYAVENKGLATYGRDDPFVGRIVATKRMLTPNA